jgi:hypothetical protein
MRAKAGEWKYTGAGNYHFSLLDVKKLNCSDSRRRWIRILAS